MKLFKGIFTKEEQTSQVRIYTLLFATYLNNMNLFNLVCSSH